MSASNIPSLGRREMPTGYARTHDGRIRAWVRVSSTRDGFNELVTHRFPSGTRPADLRAWRVETRRRLQQRLEQHRQTRAARHGHPGTLRADILEQYLPAVTAMTTYTDRCRDLAHWIDAFGDRPRSDIQPHEMRAVCQRWLTVGPRRRWRRVNGVGQWIDVAEPLAPATVNHRLRALSNVWTVLDGRRAPNPVREVEECTEHNEIPRAIDYDTIRLILAAMPNRGVGLRDQKRSKDSGAKVRARVLAWTGITPKEMSLLRLGDVRLDESLLIVAPRRKGRGAAGRFIPLNDDAKAALQDFIRLNLFGRFCRRTVLRAWQRASRKVLGHTTRLYDLRHSFITSIVHATKDLRVAGLLAGHGANSPTTQRYAMAALLPMLRAGVAAFTESVKEKPS